ncbi:MAG: homoserine kinase [Cyanobacteria bacterium REEB65]|nr:homoserine kinase [Cyanobacteria bacterium REEB65]
MLDGCRVRVPATSANLGPGFDALGMALDFGMEILVERSELDRFEGRGETAELRDPAGNLLFSGCEAVFAQLGMVRPKLAITCNSQIPLARGLGSSAAAICAGVVAANALVGDPLDRAQLLEIAARLEGHPDNVGPALHGGVTVAVQDGPVHIVPVPLSPSLLRDLALVLAIPTLRLETREARAVLPERVSHEDAVFNAGRVALLVAALAQGNLAILQVALQDRLHQPYRAAMIPQGAAVETAARAAGALAVTISGAGPTLLAWCPKDREEAVAAAMKAVWPDATVHPTTISFAGTVLA